MVEHTDGSQVVMDAVRGLVYALEPLADPTELSERFPDNGRYGTEETNAGTALSSEAFCYLVGNVAPLAAEAWRRVHATGGQPPSDREAAMAHDFAAWRALPLAVAAVWCVKEATPLDGLPDEPELLCAAHKVLKDAYRRFVEAMRGESQASEPEEKKEVAHA